jgi:hypothetical protein
VPETVGEAEEEDHAAAGAGYGAVDRAAIASVSFSLAQFFFVSEHEKNFVRINVKLCADWVSCSHCFRLFL